MKWVYCVFSPCDDPYAGDDHLITIFSSREKAIKFVTESNSEFDREHGHYAKYYYFYFERWFVE